MITDESVKMTDLTGVNETGETAGMAGRLGGETMGGTARVNETNERALYERRMKKT